MSVQNLPEKRGFNIRSKTDIAPWNIPDEGLLSALGSSSKRTVAWTLRHWSKTPDPHGESQYRPEPPEPSTVCSSSSGEHKRK